MSASKKRTGASLIPRTNSHHNHQPLLPKLRLRPCHACYDWGRTNAGPWISVQDLVGLFMERLLCSLRLVGSSFSLQVSSILSFKYLISVIRHGLHPSQQKGSWLSATPDTATAQRFDCCISNFGVILKFTEILYCVCNLILG